MCSGLLGLVHVHKAGTSGLQCAACGVGGVLVGGGCHVDDGAPEPIASYPRGSKQEWCCRSEKSALATAVCIGGGDSTTSTEQALLRSKLDTV